MTYTAVLYACVRTKDEHVGCDGYRYVLPTDIAPETCHIAGCNAPMYRVGEFELEAA